MRNRGIELFALMERDHAEAGIDGSYELRAVLGAEGIPGSTLPAAMAGVHAHVAKCTALRHW
jgi:hypothetical protein